MMYFWQVMYRMMMGMMAMMMQAIMGASSTRPSLHPFEGGMEKSVREKMLSVAGYDFGAVISDVGFNATTQVLFILGQTQNSHNFRCRSNIKT